MARGRLLTARWDNSILPRIPKRARNQRKAKGGRLALVPSDCAEFQFKLDLAPTAEDGETVIEASGIRIFVNRGATGLIKGTRIDYVESLEGGSFIFQNPNAESTCVCGQSFTLLRHPRGGKYRAGDWSSPYP
jgi:iron-sulfur cluster assembly accessory protein